jgi:membrane protein implicated in regulation of membrane protease activity
MRQKSARVCLVVAVVWFILGAFVLGNAPEWFATSAAFAAVAAFLGVRSVRISAVVLVFLSVAVAIGAYEARQNLKARVREIQRKASERKSSIQEDGESGSSRASHF